MERSQKMAAIAVGVALLLLVVSIRHVFFRGEKQPPTPQEAVKILLTSSSETRKSEAVQSLQMAGEDSLPLLKELFVQATTDDQRGIAANLVLAKPPTHDTISTLVDLLAHNAAASTKRQITVKLERCTGQSFGADAGAWNDWWEREGKHYRNFFAPGSSTPWIDDFMNISEEIKEQNHEQARQAARNWLAEHGR